MSYNRAQRAEQGDEKQVIVNKLSRNESACVRVAGHRAPIYFSPASVGVRTHSTSQHGNTAARRPNIPRSTQYLPTTFVCILYIIAEGMAAINTPSSRAVPSSRSCAQHQPPVSSYVGIICARPPSHSPLLPAQSDCCSMMLPLGSNKRLSCPRNTPISSRVYCLWMAQ